MPAGTYQVAVSDGANCYSAFGKAVIKPGAGPCVAAPASSAASMQAQVTIAAVNPKLSVTLLPNPSAYQFTIIVNGNALQPVTITVVDILGRKVYSLAGQANAPYVFGGSLGKGIYIAKVFQAGQSTSVKLVKQ